MLEVARGLACMVLLYRLCGPSHTVAQRAQAGVLAAGATAAAGAGPPCGSNLPSTAAAHLDRRAAPACLFAPCACVCARVRVCVCVCVRVGGRWRCFGMCLSNCSAWASAVASAWVLLTPVTSTPTKPVIAPSWSFECALCSPPCARTYTPHACTPPWGGAHCPLHKHSCPWVLPCAMKPQTGSVVSIV